MQAETIEELRDALNRSLIAQTNGSCWVEGWDSKSKAFVIAIKWKHYDVRNGRIIVHVLVLHDCHRVRYAEDTLDETYSCHPPTPALLIKAFKNTKKECRYHDAWRKTK